VNRFLRNLVDAKSNQSSLVHPRLPASIKIDSMLRVEDFAVAPVEVEEHGDAPALAVQPGPDHTSSSTSLTKTVETRHRSLARLRRSTNDPPAETEHPRAETVRRLTKREPVEETPRRKETDGETASEPLAVELLRVHGTAPKPMDRAHGDPPLAPTSPQIRPRPAARIFDGEQTAGIQSPQQAMTTKLRREPEPSAASADRSINISIGRVIVTAKAPAKRATTRRTGKKRVMSLASYLERRQNKGGS